MSRFLLLVAVVAAVVAVAPAGAHEPSCFSYAGATSGVVDIGHEHADCITLSTFSDWASAREGGDSYWGLGGADTLYMGSGPDFANGQGGEDDIIGGDGLDQLYGGDQNDVIKGGDGNDFIDCGAGSNDRAYGNLGNDTFSNCDGNAIE